LIQRVLQEWGDLKEEEQGDLIEGALYVVDSYEYRFFNSFTEELQVALWLILHSNCYCLGKVPFQKNSAHKASSCAGLPLPLE
jgi:hypothetical protein